MDRINVKVAPLTFLVIALLPSPAAYANDAKLTVQERDRLFGFKYDVYKEGKAYEMDTYGHILQALVRDVRPALRSAELMEEELREATRIRVFGYLILAPSAIFLVSAPWGSGKGARVFYGLLGGVLGTVIVSKGNGQARDAYRHLFDVVNAYNEPSERPGKDGVASGTKSPPDETGEGTFPPGLPPDHHP